MLQRMVDSFTSKQMDVPVPNNFDDNWGPPFPPPQRKGDGVQQQQQYQLSSGSSPPSLPTPPKSSYTRISNGVEHMATENGSSSSFSKISQMTQEIARLSAELEREHHRELAKAGGKSSNAEINELKRELQLREQQFDEVMFHNDQLKSKVDKEEEYRAVKERREDH
uniref:Uncharacterized protein n=1 Tax=Ditylenchus dipsaci TaxID=166011 RepID=A0A915EJT7_9BILA